MESDDCRRWDKFSINNKTCGGRYSANEWNKHAAPVDTIMRMKTKQILCVNLNFSFKL